MDADKRVTHLSLIHTWRSLEGDVERKPSLIISGTNCQR